MIAKDKDIDELAALAYTIAKRRKQYINNPKIATRDQEILRALNHLLDEMMELVDSYKLNMIDTIFIEGKPHGFGTELADIIILCLSLSKYMGFSIEKEITTKLKYNCQRHD